MTADVNAITVNAPDVTIDLNGCTIRSSIDGGSIGNGIEIPAVSNVEIRNGSINDIPAMAIKAIGGSGLRLIDVRVTTAGSHGLLSTTILTTVDRCDFSYCGLNGINIAGVSSVRVTNSAAVQNGRSGISLTGVQNGEVSGCRVDKNQRAGIAVSGFGCQILNNTVTSNNIDKLATDGGIKVGDVSTLRGNIVAYNWINGIVITGVGSSIEGNNINYTKNAAGSENFGVSLYSLANCYSFYLNNRISPSNNVKGGPGTSADYGGNIIFQ